MPSYTIIYAIINRQQFCESKVVRLTSPENSQSVIRIQIAKVGFHSKLLLQSKGKEENRFALFKKLQKPIRHQKLKVSLRVVPNQ